MNSTNDTPRDTESNTPSATPASPAIYESAGSSPVVLPAPLRPPLTPPHSVGARSPVPSPRVALAPIGSPRGALPHLDSPRTALPPIGSPRGALSPRIALPRLSSPRKVLEAVSEHSVLGSSAVGVSQVLGSPLAGVDAPPPSTTDGDIPISPTAANTSAQVSPAASTANLPTSPLGKTSSAPTSPLQSRLLDTPIDLHELEVGAPTQDAGEMLPDSPPQNPLVPASTLSARSAPFQPASAALQTSSTEWVRADASPWAGPSGNAGASSVACATGSPSASSGSPTSPITPTSPAVADTSSASAMQSVADAEGRTPNVYINGLPPNFPEEELFKMTREFGTVVSVRTFTRHVCDRPSGYGFVLFETIEAAERCIETLRKYRNLHPSFSKQIHKIPGTVYSSPSFTSSSTQSRLPTDSFKARMEQLKDTSSTNLYMEGLPTSINEHLLAALVKPYRIMSSRFFKTRLSSPPRIIAFVRLETRAAAEEIIERLHGRLVRGLQDSGCRISVRFADTSEQRELRRMERMIRDGEQSPARSLSMAQAALLNLKGAQLGPESMVSPLASPEFGLSHVNSPLLTNAASPLLANPTSPLLANALLHGAGGMTLPQLARSPYHQQQHFGHALKDMQDLSMLADATAYDGMDFSSNAAQYARIQDELASLRELQLARAARAENGFTPMERMLLQAHTQRQQQQSLAEAQRQQQLEAQAQRQQEALEAQQRISQSRGLVASIHAQPAGGSLRREASRRLLDVLPPMSEDDFHASRGGGRLQPLSDVDTSVGMSPLSRAATQQPSHPALNLDQQLSLHSPVHQRNQTHAVHAEAHPQGVHTRSTTHPSEYLGGRGVSQSFLNGSAQNTNTNSMASSILSHSTNSVRSSMNNSIGSVGFGTNGSSIGNFGSNDLNSNSSSTNMSYVGNGKHASFSTNTSNHLRTSTNHSNGNSSNNQGSPNISVARGGTDTIPTSPVYNYNVNRSKPEEDRSPLVSPALTYSARSPATLSPVTPFSGFFHAEETFEGLGMGAGVGVVGEKGKMRAGVQARNEGDCMP